MRDDDGQRPTADARSVFGLERYGDCAKERAAALFDMSVAAAATAACEDLLVFVFIFDNAVGACVFGSVFSSLGSEEEEEKETRASTLRSVCAGVSAIVVAFCLEEEEKDVGCLGGCGCGCFCWCLYCFSCFFFSGFSITSSLFISPSFLSL